MPAIHNLMHEKNISTNTAVVGFARANQTNLSFRKQMQEAVSRFSRISNNNSWDQFEDKIFYNQGNFDQDEAYENLHKLLADIDAQHGTKGNRIFYLATQPSHFSTIIKKLCSHQLIYKPKDAAWSKVVIEKPFGTDLESASSLQKDISTLLDESQVYRMDHYLGKEGVQNIFTFRFEGGLFEPLWNNKHIENVQITLSEDIGIGSRAHFWEETGSLRDIFQNHLLQLLAITAMEPPLTNDTAHIYEEKLKLLRAIRPFPNNHLDECMIRGQYDKGTIGGVSVPGYKQEKGVLEDSLAETYIAATLFIDNPRWQGIPFYIRGGKRLSKQTTQIVVSFKNTAQPSHPNTLYFRIQPEAGIFIKTMAKVPALGKSTDSIIFGCRPDSFFRATSAEAYEKLLYDCIKGDKNLFVQGQEQLIAWRLLEPVLNHWKSKSISMQSYEAGTSGPLNAETMLQQNGHNWHLLD